MNKVLLITGASSDTGISLIQRVCHRYDVILAHYCHSNERLLELRETMGDKLQLCQADFKELASVERMLAVIQERGIIPNHIVHISAQRTVNQRLHKTEWNEYAGAMETALRSIVLIVNRFVPYMKKAKEGKIIFMLTSCTLNNPPKYQVSYVVAKYALLGLMKSLSVEYAENGIMVNGVSPDMMDTKFLSDMPDLVIRQNAEKSPLKRNLAVDDVVPTFDFLLSEAADTITGQNIGITGGI